MVLKYIFLIAIRRFAQGKIDMSASFYSWLLGIALNSI